MVGGADLAHGTEGRPQLVRQEVQVVREVADLARVVDHLLAAGVVVAVDAEAGGFAPVQVLHVAGSGLHHVLFHPLLVDGKSRDGFCRARVKYLISALNKSWKDGGETR